MNTENDVANRIVYSDPRGNVIRLRDIATIKREYPHADKYVKNNGQKCIVLSVEMNEGSNIVQFGNKVKDILGQFEASLPQDVSIYTITDQSEVVNSSVVDFLKELLIAIASVVVVIMLLLPMRVASVAASTIPITIFITLGLFYALGFRAKHRNPCLAYRGFGYDCRQLHRYHRLVCGEDRRGHESLARRHLLGQRVLFVYFQCHTSHFHHLLPAVAHDERHDERLRKVVPTRHQRGVGRVTPCCRAGGSLDAVHLYTQRLEERQQRRGQTATYFPRHHAELLRPPYRNVALPIRLSP